MYRTKMKHNSSKILTRLFTTFLLWHLVVPQASALPIKMPSGCLANGFEMKEQDLWLNMKPVKQTVYLFHNNTEDPVDLAYYDPKHPTLGHWRTTLDAKRWSSFAADMPMLFSCTTNHHAANLDVDCQQVLQVCRYQNAKVPLHMRGTYFIIKNQYSKALVVRDTIREGALLR
jgi:hypothetical protein